jgi:hypothetical protein
MNRQWNQCRPREWSAPPWSAEVRPARCIIFSMLGQSVVIVSDPEHYCLRLWIDYVLRKRANFFRPPAPITEIVPVRRCHRMPRNYPTRLGCGCQLYVAARRYTIGQCPLLAPTSSRR